MSHLHWKLQPLTMTMSNQAWHDNAITTAIDELQLALAQKSHNL